MKKEDLDKLEESKEIQRLIRYSKEQYEMEKADHPPIAFSSVMHSVRQRGKKKNGLGRISPWWLAAACLLGWIAGFALSGGNSVQPDRLAVADTIVVVHERIDTVYREVKAQVNIPIATRKVSKPSSASPEKNVKRSKHATEQISPEYISPLLFQQTQSIPDPESDCYAANGMTVAEDNYPLHLLVSAPCK